MFSEDKFNELMKNLKAGKDVPTPKPEPVLRHKSKGKSPKRSIVAPRSQTGVGDVGDWLNQVDSLKADIARNQQDRQRLTEERNLLSEEVSRLQLALKQNEARPDLSSNLSDMGIELDELKLKVDELQCMNNLENENETH